MSAVYRHNHFGCYLKGTKEVSPCLLEFDCCPATSRILISLSFFTFYEYVGANVWSSVQIRTSSEWLVDIPSAGPRNLLSSNACLLTIMRKRHRCENHFSDFWLINRCLCLEYWKKVDTTEEADMKFVVFFFTFIIIGKLILILCLHLNLI